MEKKSNSAAKAASLLVGLAVGLVIGLGIGQRGSGNNPGNATEWTSARPVRGPTDAPVTIVEFMDYQCPACRLFHDRTYETLLMEYGDRIRWEVRNFPLENIHPNARPAARAAVCAHQQGRFWEFHDVLFSTESSDLRRDVFLERAEALALDLEAYEACLDSDASADMVAGDFLHGISRGVRSTPTFFVNDRMLTGAQPIDSFREAIDASVAGAPDPGS